MTRSYHSTRPRARRVTQPMIVLRMRDPSVHVLGFTSFRMIAMPDGGYTIYPYSDPRNPMTVFVQQAV
jgi:hypothetical protein